MNRILKQLAAVGLALLVDTSSEARDAQYQPKGDDLSVISRDNPAILANKVVDLHDIADPGKFVMYDGKKRKGIQYTVNTFPTADGKPTYMPLMDDNVMINVSQVMYTDVGPKGPSSNDEIQYTIVVTDMEMRGGEYVPIPHGFVKKVITQKEILDQPGYARGSTWSEKYEKWQLARIIQSLDHGNWYETDMVEKQEANLQLVIKALDQYPGVQPSAVSEFEKSSNQMDALLDSIGN